MTPQQRTEAAPRTEPTWSFATKAADRHFRTHVAPPAERAVIATELLAIEAEAAEQSLNEQATEGSGPLAVDALRERLLNALNAEAYRGLWSSDHQHMQPMRWDQDDVVDRIIEYAGLVPHEGRCEQTDGIGQPRWPNNRCVLAMGHATDHEYARLVPQSLNKPVKEEPARPADTALLDRMRVAFESEFDDQWPEWMHAAWEKARAALAAQPTSSEQDR